MAQDWNPNDPGTVGLEWFPTTITGTPATQGRGVAMTVDSTATETIANAWVGFDTIQSAGRWLLDVFVEGNEVPGATTTATGFVPSTDLLNNSNLWVNQAGSAVNIFGSIDNGTTSPASYITYDGSYTQTNTAIFTFGTAGWPAARRVLQWTLTFTAAATGNVGQGRMQVLYRAGGVNYTLANVTLSSSVETFTVTLGELNPATALPWTETEVEAVATTAGFGFRAQSGRTVGIEVYQFDLSISYVTENRVAVGAAGSTTALSTPEWQTFPLQNPNSGVANWSKANATTYTFLLRPVAPVAALAGVLTPCVGSVRTLDSGSALPTGSVSYQPALTGAGAVLSMGDERTFGMALALDVNASATDSVDGMPYIQLVAGTADIAATQQATGQEVDGASAANYAVVRFIATWLPTSVLPTPSNPLVVEVIRQSDAVVIGSASVTPDEFADLPAVADASSPLPAAAGGTLSGYDDAEWRYAEVSISATLAAGTVYEVQFTSTTNGGTDGRWVVMGLTTDDRVTASRGNPATYGGTTLVAADSGPPLYNLASVDLNVTLSTVPDPVENVSVRYEHYDTDNLGCNPTLIPYNIIQWAASALGADFGYYQIERGDDGTWTQIAQITSEDVQEFHDAEFPFGTDIAYRIRVVRDGDLIASDWTTTATINNEADCVLYFSSNLLDTQLAYNPGDRITYQFASSDEVEIVAPTGVDYQTALVPVEWRGDVFETDVSVWTPPTRGRAAPDGEKRWTFDPLISLSRAQVPYICVRDETGRVWYANVNVREGTADNSAASANNTASLVVTELTDTPSIIDVSIDSDVLLLDLFNRADVADIDGSLPNVGPAWDTLNFAGGAIGIISEQAYASGIDAVGANIAYVQGLDLDSGWLETTFTYQPPSAANHTTAPLLWRANFGTFNAWQVNIPYDPGFETLFVQRIDGGVPVVYYEEPLTFDAGDTVTMRVDYAGPYHVLSLSGTVFCTIVDDTYATQTQVGFGVNTPGVRFEQIEAGAWPDDYEPTDLSDALIWLDARSLDTSYDPATDPWPNLGTNPDGDGLYDPPGLVGCAGCTAVVPVFENPGGVDSGLYIDEGAPTVDQYGFAVENTSAIDLPEGASVTWVHDFTPTTTSEAHDKRLFFWRMLLDSSLNSAGFNHEDIALFPATTGEAVMTVSDGTSDGAFGNLFPQPPVGVRQQWVQVVNRDDATLSAYINGEFKASMSIVGCGALTSTVWPVMGGGQSVHKNLWFSRALTAAEIAELAAEMVGPVFPSSQDDVYEPFLP